MSDILPENMRSAPPDKRMMAVFVNYMSKMHSEKWSALVDCAKDVEERLRDSFYKTWNRPVISLLAQIERDGGFTERGRQDYQRMMPNLAQYITVGLLPGRCFFNNPPRPDVDIVIMYGGYRVQHTLSAEEFEYVGVEALRAHVLSLEQHIKLRLGA